MADDPAPRPGARWLSLPRRRRAAIEAEMREEVEAHVALGRDYLVARGRSPEDAERVARARFGDFDSAIRRLCASAREREEQMERRRRVDELRQDVALAMRRFRTAPGFFAAAVATLALGIGANGAIFGVLRATLLEPLPYANPAELVMVWRTPALLPAGAEGEARGFWRGYLTASTLLGWRHEPPPGLRGVAAVLSWDGNLESQFDLALADGAERLRGAFATPELFTLLGVRAARGRLFQRSDEDSGEPLAVLSHDLWQRAFGSDPRIVGRTLTLTTGRVPRQQRTFTVLGVLPRGFRFTYPEETEIWALMPWSAVERYPRDAIAFQVIGRVAPGVSLEQATERLAHVRTGLERPGERPEHRQVLRAEPVREWVVGEVRPSLRLLGGVALLLLLITCVTVAAGLLVRTSARQRELAVRASLGASRARLVRQLITEGAILSVAGAVAGSVAAVAAQPVLRTILPASVPRVAELAAGAWVIAFAAGMAGVTIILAAIAPAFGGTRLDVAASALRAAATASADPRAARWRQILVGTQAAVASALLVAAALLLASFWRLGQQPLGFDGHEVVTAEMRLLGERYRQAGARTDFQRRLVEHMRATPGILDVGLTSAVPFRGVDFMLVLTPAGGEREYAAHGRFVDPGFFRVMRIPLLRGRLLDDADSPGSARVMVISESYARKAFGSVDPIGRMMDYRGPAEIVGVVGDVRYAGRDREPGEAVYLPRAQHPEALVCVVARSVLPTELAIAALRRAIREVDPAVPAMRLTTIDRIVDESVADRRFYTASTAAFAGLALVLALSGLVTMVARAAVERRQELAIRSALGATIGHLVRQSARDGLIAVGAGLATGLAAAWVGSIVLAQFLFQVPPRPPGIYAGVAALLLAGAWLAAWATARRLGRMPLAALLRAE